MNTVIQRLSSVTSFSQSGKERPVLGTSGMPGKENEAPKSRLSVAGDWLAPILVWFLVISMGSAIVGFLLSER